MTDKFLYEELDAVSKMGFLKKEVPDFLKDNLKLSSTIKISIDIDPYGLM